MTASGRREGWRLLRATLAAQKRGIALGGLVGLLWSGTKIAVPLLVGAAINRAVDGQGSLLAWSVTIVVIGFVAGTLSASRRYLAFREARLTERGCATGCSPTSRRSTSASTTGPRPAS